MAIFTADSVFKAGYGAERTELVMADDRVDLRLAMPWLAGRTSETLGTAALSARPFGEFVVGEEDGQLVGAVVVDAREQLEQTTERVYRELLRHCEGWNLHRIWNYVPQINQFQAGLERYQQFNIGRWVAFEERFGRDLRSFMPAASAVGIGGDHLAIIFTAGRQRPVFFENPAQVPAYHYPPDYGPRPPGFARGVTIEGPGMRTVFLSGTASIEGHRSVGEGDWALQFRTTLHNIETMMDRMGVPQALDARTWESGEIVEGGLKCYLRHTESLSVIQDWMQEHTGLTEKHIAFVQADICRAELDIEIEATVKVRCGET